jgi:hypothetical protein
MARRPAPLAGLVESKNVRDLAARKLKAVPPPDEPESAAEVERAAELERASELEPAAADASEPAAPEAA